MTDRKIVEKAMIKAIKNEFRWVHFASKLGIEGVIRDVAKELVKSNRVECLVFDNEFAKALNYKLKDLGEWCDFGKSPLEYINLVKL